MLNSYEHRIQGGCQKPESSDCADSRDLSIYLHSSTLVCLQLLSGSWKMQGLFVDVSVWFSTTSREWGRQLNHTVSSVCDLDQVQVRRKVPSVCTCMWHGVEVDIAWCDGKTHVIRTLSHDDTCIMPARDLLPHKVNNNKSWREGWKRWMDGWCMMYWIVLCCTYTYRFMIRCDRSSSNTG